MQAQLYKRIKPTLRKDRIGIYMHVQCSPVMASFLCKNFVWVEFEDIQHCLGFLNIWQIEKKKTPLQKVWPNFAAKHPEILAVASAHAQISCRGQCLNPALLSIITRSAHRLHRECLNTFTRKILSVAVMATGDRETDVERKKWSSQASTPA